MESSDSVMAVCCLAWASASLSSLLLRRQPLTLIGADLLVGDLPLTQLRQDLLDLIVSGGAWARGAYQDLLKFEIVDAELGLHVPGRDVLDFAAILQQLDQGLRLPDVLEVGRYHRVQGLLDKSLDVAEPLDDQRRLSVVDVHHDRQGQGRLKGVAGDQRHLGQILIQLVGPADVAVPFEDKVGGRHHQYAARIGVEGIFSRQQRIVPDAPAAVRDQFAVAIVGARRVDTVCPCVRNHDTHLSHLHRGLGDQFDRREQPVDVVGAFDEDL
jgi:hypothetical protein